MIMGAIKHQSIALLTFPASALSANRWGYEPSRGPHGEMRSDTDPRISQAILGTEYRLLTDVSKLVRSVRFPLLVALAVKKTAASCSSHWLVLSEWVVRDCQCKPQFGPPTYINGSELQGSVVVQNSRQLGYNSCNVEVHSRNGIHRGYHLSHLSYKWQYYWR